MSLPAVLVMLCASGVAAAQPVKVLPPPTDAPKEVSPTQDPSAPVKPDSENSAPTKADGSTDTATAGPAVPYPHPLITEVLFTVPTGEAGDASGDGKREVAGDEFVEIVNPHSKPIQLLGYTLTDSNEPNKGQLKFRFPALELAPGAVVVVFNGNATVFSGPVGSARAPASAGNPGFGGARVFSINAASSRQAFNNSSDYVLLSAPDKRKVHRVAWGPAAKAGLGKAGAEAIMLADSAPDMVRGSVQREGVGELDSFVQHDRIDPERLFSPGVFGAVAEATGKSEDEGEKSPEATGAPTSGDQKAAEPKKPS